MLSASVHGIPQKDGQTRAASLSVDFPPPDKSSNALTALGDPLRIGKGHYIGDISIYIPFPSDQTTYIRKRKDNCSARTCQRLSVVAKKTGTERDSGDSRLACCVALGNSLGLSELPFSSCNMGLNRIEPCWFVLKIILCVKSLAQRPQK